MLLFYNLGLRLYFLSIRIASLFNKKAKQWIDGRKNADYGYFEKSAWFHFASLGEYEQGLPVLMRFKTSYSELNIIITFFSPSGFEVRRNSPYADAVYYLPLDTKRNARKFIAAINPTIAIFTKYEYWYHFFDELYQKDIPLYIISGIFRRNHVFFKWYGGLHRKMLSFVTRFFVQDEESKLLLQTINVENVSVGGDTRFDRVWANAQQPKHVPLIEEFKKGQKVFIAGSTWPEDEALLAQLPSLFPDWKFIIAPHEISDEKIDRLIDELPINSSKRYSQLTAQNSQQTLIIDNIGMLSSLYQYAEIAYIGGGFGAGIHNTLEAAAFGLPIIFGPNYKKFKEARDLIALRVAYSISNERELKSAVSYLAGDDNHYQPISKKVKAFVAEHIGATDTIMGYISKV